MLIFGVLLAPAYFRLVYTMVTAVRNELYVDAARVSGLSDLRIIGRHILSVVRAPIIIQTAIVAIIAIADPVRPGVPRARRHLGADLGWHAAATRSRRSTRRRCSCCGPRSRSALTSIALMLLANAIRDVLERTVVVRRKRRRAVTTRTGSVAAVTTATSVTDLGDELDIVTPDGDRSGTTTTSRHPIRSSRSS